MQQPDTSEIRVIFQPMNRVLTVPAGTPLFDAMRLAGIAIERICGGKGTCGKCRVILTAGTCTAAPEAGTGCRLTQKERDEGYYLACQVTLIRGCGVYDPGGEPDRFPPDPDYAAGGTRRDRACSHALPGGNGAIQRPAICLPVDPVCGILRLTAPHTDEQYHSTACRRNPAGSHALDCQVAPGSACHLPCQVMPPRCTASPSISEPRPLSAASPASTPGRSLPPPQA